MKTTIKVARVECGSQVDETSQVEREVTYSPDEVTVVESSDKVLYTKKLVYEGGKLVNKVSAPHATWHKATNRSVATHEDLYGLLLELSENKTACIVRGQVFDCHQGSKVRRTHRGGWKRPSHTGAPTAQTAYFAGVPRRWLCVDIDGDDAKGLDCFVYAPVLSGPPAEVAHFMAHWLVNVWLPEPFRGRRAVVQFSSSFWASGVSSKVKAHIWFLLDEAVDPRAIQEVMWQAYSNVLAGDGKPFVMGAEEGQRRLDGSTARVSHPNFTASPLVIEDGVVVHDKHRDYRVIEVNKSGERVKTATLLADLDAAKEQKVATTKAAPGGVAFTKSKTENKSDETAQGDILTWTAKDHADYKLAQEALTYLGASYYDFYEPWLVVGMCIHYRFSGKEGLDLWTTWSKQSTHYTESDVAYGCVEKWGTFTTDVENPRTLGKLFGMASDNGFVLPSKATKAADETTTAEKTGEAPALPTCLAKLTEAPKSKAEYKIALLRALMALRTDNDVREVAQAHFEYMGPVALQEFLAALVVNGAAADKVALISRALQPQGETILTLPTVNGVPIGFTEVSGFVVGDSGVCKEVFTELGERTLVPILRTPLFVLSEDEPIDLGQATGVRLTLCWRNHGVWTTYRVPVQDVSEKSKIVASLAPLGVQITSADAAAVVAYIAAYRHCNAMNIAHNIYTTRLGWQSRHGEIVGFMLGTTWMPVLGQTLEVQYQPESEGMVADAESFAQTKGDKDAWVGMLNGLADHPIAAAMVYAACCAPLLAVVGGQGFTLDLGGKTSTGKTTAMRVAASVWGSPVDGDSRKVFSNWKTTANAVEARCARSNDLPLMLDDTKEASHASVTSEVVYMITNGQAKARGTQTGGYRTGFNFRKVLISTGENLILDTNEHGGVRARVVSLSDLPFGAKSEAGGKLTRSLRDSAGSHYGHAGRLIVDYLCATKDDWAELREEYKAECAKLQETTGEDGVNSRVAEYVVLMRLAGKLLCDLTGATLPVEAHIDAIWAQCSKASTQSDPSTNALSLVWNYVAKQPHRLEGSTSAPMNDLVPNGGWLGRRGQKEGKAVVYVLPDELKKVLQDAGHNFNALTRSWSDDGLIASDKEGKHSVKVRIAGTPLRALCFNLDAVLSALDVSETNPYENDSPI